MSRKPFLPHEVYPRVKQAVEQGASTIVDIAKAVGVSRGTLGGRFRDDFGLSSEHLDQLPIAIETWLEANAEEEEPKPIQFEIPEPTPEEYEETIYNEDRSIILKRVLAIAEEDKKDANRVMELCGFDPAIWIVKDIRVTYWLGQRGQSLGGGPEPLSAVKLHVAPKMLGKVSVQDTIDLIRERLSDIPAAPKIQLPKWEQSDFVAEPVITDTHFISQPFEGLPNSMETFAPAFSEIIQDVRDARPQSILLPIMGDISHVDTAKGTTSSFTQLEISGSPNDCVDESLTFMLWATEELAQIAPLDIVFVWGNHDQLLLYALAQAIELRFRDNKHVTVDASKALRKVRLVGDNLLGMMHGDMPKARNKVWLADEFPELWGPSTYREIHAGHLHSEMVDELGGVWLRHQPSPAIADHWHYDKGYSNRGRAFPVHLWNTKRAGRPKTWSVPVN